MGITLSQKILERYSRTSFEYRSVTDSEALDQVLRGEAHLALVTSEVPNGKGLVSKTISEPYFQTFAGPKHPDDQAVNFESRRPRRHQPLHTHDLQAVGSTFCGLSAGFSELPVGSREVLADRRHRPGEIQFPPFSDGRLPRNGGN